MISLAIGLPELNKTAAKTMKEPENDGSIKAFEDAKEETRTEGGLEEVGVGIEGAGKVIEEAGETLEEENGPAGLKETAKALEDVGEGLEDIGKDLEDAPQDGSAEEARNVIGLEEAAEKAFSEVGRKN
ncbi:OLC1v1021231C1 [Oldenlandia corymbosa var. corymbosa]|uniref:OLC1v1021231C1 n=1 Tax=Oldenlandia corymbosa var. corymbosa TaxID=529605 RepID=A0AAV1BYU5_OLDCO|nr:OLC1v1021231C1 [Oldenlandia corymbosa var. corymbosa]